MAVFMPSTLKTENLLKQLMVAYVQCAYRVFYPPGEGVGLCLAGGSNLIKGELEI